MDLKDNRSIFCWPNDHLLYHCDGFRYPFEVAELMDETDRALFIVLLNSSWTMSWVPSKWINSNVHNVCRLVSDLDSTEDSDRNTLDRVEFWCDVVNGEHSLSDRLERLGPNPHCFHWSTLTIAEKNTTNSHWTEKNRSIYFEKEWPL